MAEATLAALPPQINESKLNDFGTRLFAQYEKYKIDRKPAEERWLRALRQFRGIYDSEVLSMIPKNCSKAYPKLTRWKVIGTIARLMAMLFPQTEKNYGIAPSPMPDLPLEQLQEVLNRHVMEKAAATQTDPRDVVCTDEEIEKAIVEYAKGRSDRMETKIDDDLQEMEYVTLARRVVFSATLYNIGILQGPLNVKKKSRTWRRDPNLGGYTAVEEDKLRPLYEFLPVWSYYPDMGAVSLDKQDGYFIRHIMTRGEVEALADRPDFLSERVHKWLRENTSGNHKPLDWEEQIKGEPKSDRHNMTGTTTKYEAAAYYGSVTGHDLRAAGVPISDAQVGLTFNGNVWTLDNTIIKCRLLPLGAEVKQHHVFMFEEDDLSLMGNGLCDTLRDSQLSVCETARAALDNMSVIGPMMEVNDDLLTLGQDVTISKHKVWRREGEGQSAGVAAVRNINVESHLSELVTLLNVFMEFGDKESGLPPPSLGDTSGGGSEALRTSKNASIFMGAAALPVRDTVRNFDTFTTSVISALVAWNKKFDPHPSRDGDFNIIARGSTSLVSKEILATALNEFGVSLAPEERAHIKERKLLEAKMKANDIPADLLEDEAVAQQKIQRMQDAAAKLAQSETRVNDAKAEELTTKSLLNYAKSQSEAGLAEAEAFDALVRLLETGEANDLEREKIGAMLAKAAKDSEDKKEIAAMKPAPAKAAA